MAPETRIISENEHTAHGIHRNDTGGTVQYAIYSHDKASNHKSFHYIHMPPTSTQLMVLWKMGWAA